MIWLVSTGELTPEQIKAIELKPNRHRLILGAPGSGKTQILLHRARYLIDNLNTHRERYHIFVFNNVLKNYIESALHLLNIPAENITTFAHWIKEFHEKYLSRMPWDPRNNQPDFKKAALEVLSFLQKDPSKHGLFDFILVDEGQDLDSVSFEILKRVSQHLTVCLDHKQQIYAGSRYFCESFFGHPCPTSGKNYATANAFGCPSRPASLVAYPTRGMQHSYAMTRRDFVKPAFSLRKKRSVKTHALSLLGTTRLLSRSERRF